jgi:hypothetical protein
MALRKYTLNEIMDCTRLGKTKWGFIFFDDGEIRQSIDFYDQCVVVEKYFQDEWRTMTSYYVHKLKEKPQEVFN